MAMPLGVARSCRWSPRGCAASRLGPASVDTVQREDTYPAETCRSAGTWALVPAERRQRAPEEQDLIVADISHTTASDSSPERLSSETGATSRPELLDQPVAEGEEVAG